MSAVFRQKPNNEYINEYIAHLNISYASGENTLFYRVRYF